MSTAKQSNFFMLVLTLVFVAAALLYAYVSSWLAAYHGIILSDAAASVVLQLIQLFLPVLCVALYRNKKNEPFAMLEKPKASNVAMAVFMALTAIPLAGAVSSLSSLFFSDLAVEGITEITSSVGSLPVALAVTALVPAVFEELAFRGVILYGYRNVGVHKAALLNGFFFGMIHMNFRQFFYAFMLGVLLAYVVYISRSLVLGMVMHFTVNATSVVLTYALAAIEDVPEAALETSTAGDGVFSPGYILYVLIFTLIFVQIFRRFKRRNSADNSGEPSAVQKEKILSVPFFASIAVFVIVAVLIELATQNRL